MCTGNNGPSAAELAQMEAAAAEKAKAEADRITAEKEKEKQTENARIVAEQAAAANSDAARRAKNRTLLNGLDAEEGVLDSEEEDPEKKSAKKARRATLIGAY